MKINFNSKILNLKKQPISNLVDGKETELILKDVCVNALLSESPPTQNQPAPTGMQKLKKYKLSQKIFEGGEQEITSDDITLIKECIGQTYNTLIVGDTYNLLEALESATPKTSK